MRKDKIFEFNSLLVSRLIRFTKISKISDDPYLKRYILGIFLKIDRSPKSRPSFSVAEEAVFLRMYEWETKFLYDSFSKIKIKKLVKKKKKKKSFLNSKRHKKKYRLKEEQKRAA